MFYKKILKCHSGNTAVYCTEKKKPKMNNCKKMTIHHYTSQHAIVVTLV